MLSQRVLEMYPCILKLSGSKRPLKCSKVARKILRMTIKILLNRDGRKSLYSYSQVRRMCLKALLQAVHEKRYRIIYEQGKKYMLLRCIESYMF
jgi:hypothetical protein